MGASRENKSIWIDLKYNRWRIFFMKIFILVSPNFIRRKFVADRSRFFWLSADKHFIIKDSFTTPYYRIVGCIIFGHKWSSKAEEFKYNLNRKYCWNCCQYGTMESIRDEKINKILK